MRRKRVFGMLTMVALCLAMAGCQTGSVFEGSKTTDASSFQLAYTLLNRQEGSALSLNAGEALRVSVAQEAGTVDLAVGMEGKAPIYEGKELANMAFVLNISESGIYQITVTGHDARGSVAFFAEETKG